MRLPRTFTAVLPRLFVPLIAYVASFVSSSFAADGDYYPLHEGDAWTYDTKIVTPDGKTFAATTYQKTGGTVMRGGKTYHLVRIWMEGAPFRSDVRSLVRKDGTGVYSLDPRSKDLKEQTRMVFPLKPGLTWQRQVQERTESEEVGAMETVVIGEKEFKEAYRVRLKASDGLTEDSWKAPHVGTVKSEVRTGGITFTATLREFKPGGR
jgi:hypothetical protein